MVRRAVASFSPLLITVLLASGSWLGGCSSDASAEASVTCTGALPTALRISEGGRLVVPRDGMLADPRSTFEGRGLKVTVTEAALTLRAPALGDVDGAPSLDVRCGEKVHSVPVELRALAWQKLAEWPDGGGPPAREYGAFWIDPTGGLVVFGGFHYAPRQFTPANDAWRFDFATGAWRELEGTDLPFLPGARAAPIPDQRAVYVFGGSDMADDGSLDTPPSLLRVEHDDQRITATPVKNLGTVGGSYTGSFLYDTKRGRWLSVCGLDVYAGFHCNVDAYTERGGFERLETTGAKPAGRHGFHYAYDEETDRVIVFAGQNGLGDLDIAEDTWALELGSDPPAWVSLATRSEAARGRRNGAFALDPTGHRLFVWGGTADGRTTEGGLQMLSLDRGEEVWISLQIPDEVPKRTSALGLRDAANDRIVFGFGNDDAIYRDLWALDLSN